MSANLIVLTAACAPPAFAHDVSGLAAATAGSMSVPHDSVPEQGYRGLTAVTLTTSHDRVRVLSAPQNAAPLETIAGDRRSATPSGWMASIFADETLHRGDVVIFPDGPMVFMRGAGDGPPWHIEDFSAVTASSGLSASAREGLLTLVGRVVPQSGPAAAKPVTVAAAVPVQ